MALQYTPRDIASGFQTTESLDQNFADIQEALQDGLSRSGQSPNDMGADIDMQGHRIYNLPSAVSNGEPVTYQQWTSQLQAVEFAGYLQELQTATAAQTEFTLSNPYTPGLGALRVFLNGLHIPSSEYTEEDVNTLTFAEPLEEGDEVVFVITSFSEADFDTASNVQYLKVDNTYDSVQNVLASLYEAEVTDILTGSKTWDPASLADGAGDTTTVTVTGASLGDFVDGISFSLDLQGCMLTGYVSASNTVSVRIQNETGTGPIDLGSGTLRARVRKL